MPVIVSGSEFNEANIKNYLSNTTYFNWNNTETIFERVVAAQSENPGGNISNPNPYTYMTDTAFEIDPSAGAGYDFFNFRNVFSSQPNGYGLLHFYSSYVNCGAWDGLGDDGVSVSGMLTLGSGNTLREIRSITQSYTDYGYPNTLPLNYIPGNNGPGGDNYNIDLSIANQRFNISNLNWNYSQFTFAADQYRLGNTSLLINLVTSEQYIYNGTNNADRAAGYDQADELHGFGGNDTLWGAGGNDTIWGDDGDDSLRDDSGNNSLSGGNGNDTITALGAGNDYIEGGNGFDLIYAGGGNDYIFGGNDDDSIEGQDGNDTLVGGTGTNQLNGGGGNDTYIIGALAVVDYITDLSGIDTLFLSNASTLDWENNFFFGDIARASFEKNVLEIFEGSAGGDRILLSSLTTANSTLYGNDGNDTLGGGAASDLMYGGNGADNMGARGGNDTMYGGAGNDSMWGDGGNDQLTGDDGSDQLYGLADDDGLLGGVGNDTLDGGIGFDTAFFYDHTGTVGGSWTIDFLANTAKTYVGSSGLTLLYETDTLISIEAAFGSGGDDDFFVRGTQNVSGYYGRDSLWLEAKTYDYLAGANQPDSDDLVDMNLGTRLRYEKSSPGAFTAVEATFSEIEIVHANVGNDTVIGSSDADEIYGDGGNDSLSGGGGNDTLSGGNGDDIIAGGTGADSIDGGANFDFASYIGATTGVTARLDYSTLNTGEAAGDVYQGIEGLIGSQLSDFLLVGNGAGNYIAALSGDDYVAGEGGNDTLRGDDGNDQIWGGLGADALDGGAGYDIARYDFAATGLVVRLDGGTNTGEATGDTFTGIEALYGSAFGSMGWAATISCSVARAEMPLPSTRQVSAWIRCWISPPRQQRARRTIMSTSAGWRWHPSQSPSPVPTPLSPPTTAR
jgi:Ca2+-binding RTX toxin-like protein